MKSLLVLAALTLTSALSPALAEELGKRFEKRDADGDGKISKEEFMSGAEKRGVEEEKAAKRFGRIDTDGDGFISSEEMGAAQERRQKRKSEKTD